MQPPNKSSSTFSTEATVYALILTALALLLILVVGVKLLADQLAVLTGADSISAVVLAFGGIFVALRAIRIRFFSDFGVPIKAAERPIAWQQLGAMVGSIMLVVILRMSFVWMLG